MLLPYKPKYRSAAAVAAVAAAAKWPSTCTNQRTNPRTNPRTIGCTEGKKDISRSRKVKIMCREKLNRV
jgi:hypothetical protein